MNRTRTRFKLHRPMVLLLLSLLAAGCASAGKDVDIDSVSDVVILPKQGEAMLSGKDIIEGAEEFQSYSKGIYLVGPGDILDITVRGEPDLSGNFEILANGIIDYPLLGQVRVSESSVSEIGEKLTRLLEKDYLREARLTIVISEYHSQKVYVFGRVSKPGIYEIGENPNLLKVLLDAGGPTSEAGDIAVLLRFADVLTGDAVTENGQGEEGLRSFKISLGNLLLRGDLSQNKRLMNGDVILVSDAVIGSTILLEQNGVYILGEIENPGYYSIKGQSTMLDLLLDAGGFTEFAAANRTKLLRTGEDGKRKTILVKAQDLIRGDKSKDILLEPGDLIVIPEGFF
ncbi:SLBB domain-containing protein [Thermodesulfobacteriota bacterium]